MPEFEYKAVAKDEYKTGTIRADSEIEAQTVLTEQGLTVVSLKTRTSFQVGLFTRLATKLEKSLYERISVSEKILFTTQLSSMIRAATHYGCALILR